MPKFRPGRQYRLSVLNCRLGFTIMVDSALGLTSWFGTKTSMVLHSLALRDVVILWVESVFILDRSEGLAVFAGVSSSVNCHFSISLAEWTLIMFSSALCFVILRVGASRVECSFLPHSLLLLFPCGFSCQGGLFNLFCCWPYPGVNPLASIVTLMYSFQLTQTSASMPVLVCVVCLRFCFPHYSTFCLPDGLQYFCHGSFSFSCGCPW